MSSSYRCTRAYWFPFSLEFWILCVCVFFLPSASLFVLWLAFCHPAPTRGTGYFLSDFFLCLFISLSERLRENGWTDFHEIFRDLGRKGARPEGPKLEDRRAESGGRVLGEGQPAPSPPAGPIYMKFSGKVRSDHGTT